MRFLLRDDSSAEGVLEQLAQAAFQVVEGNIPNPPSRIFGLGSTSLFTRSSPTVW